MGKGLRTVLWSGGIVAGTLLAAAFVCWLWTQALIHKRYDSLEPAFSPQQVMGNPQNGEYLAKVMGCDGCHGENLQGGVFFEDPMLGKSWAANLTLSAQTHSDAVLARAIREGIAPDGTSLWDMPSDAFASLSDSDLADILAYIRSKPVGGKVQPRPTFGYTGWIDLLTGAYGPMVPEVRKRRIAIDLGPDHTRGRYLAITVCGECHATNLEAKKNDPNGPPDLKIAAGYDLPAFTKLMRTGEGAGGRDLGLMSGVAKGRFTHFTDADIAALHGYLIARAQKEGEKE